MRLGVALFDFGLHAGEAANETIVTLQRPVSSFRLTASLSMPLP
jgi:hypothetical protein